MRDCIGDGLDRVEGKAPSINASINQSASQSINQVRVKLWVASGLLTADD